MSHLSKQYMRLAAKFPVDKYKNNSRNYRYFLENQIGWMFGAGQERLVKHRDDTPERNPEDLSPSYHDANLRALRELTNNEHKKRWPSDHYSTGMFGLKFEQLREANTEKSRTKLGITQSSWESFKARFWR